MPALSYTGDEVVALIQNGQDQEGNLRLLKILEADKSILKIVVAGLIGKVETIVVAEDASLSQPDLQKVSNLFKEKNIAEGRIGDLARLSGVAAVVTKNAEELEQLCSKFVFATSLYDYHEYQGTMLHIALEHSTVQIVEILVESIKRHDSEGGTSLLSTCHKKYALDNTLLIHVAIDSNDAQKFSIIWDRHAKLRDHGYAASPKELLQRLAYKERGEELCNREIFSSLWEGLDPTEQKELAKELLPFVIEHEQNYTPDTLGTIISAVDISVCSDQLAKLVESSLTNNYLPNSALFLMDHIAKAVRSNGKGELEYINTFKNLWKSYPEAGKERLLIEAVALAPESYSPEVREIIVSGVSNPKAYQEALGTLMGTHASPIHSPEFVERDDAASDSVTPQSSRTGSSASFPEVDASTRDDTPEEAHVADLLITAAAKANAAVILEEMLTSYKQALPDNNYTGILNKLMGEVSEYNQPVLAVIANAYVANLLYHSAKLDENIVPCLDANDEAVVELLKKVTFSSEEQEHFDPLWSLVKDNNKAKLAAQLLMHIAAAQTSSIYNEEICTTLLIQVLDNPDVCRKIAHSFLSGKIAAETKEALVAKMLLQHPSILLQKEDDKTTLQRMKDNKAYEEDYNYYTSQLNWNAISKTCYGAAFGVVCSSIIGSCYLLGVFNVALMPLVGIMLAITLTTAAIGYIDAEFVSKASFVESIVKSQNSIDSGASIV